MDLAAKKIVVIGGAGLIGSHTVDLLIKEDVKEILIYDNFVRGREENIRNALKDPRVKIFDVGGDIMQTDILEAALEGADGVFHFAALWLLQCHEFPRSAFNVNVQGTFNVMEACLKKNVKRLIYSSSASVYGDAVTEPMDEEHPFHNKNFYGATKIAGEAMLRAFHHRYGLSFVGLRYMNVYGPRQDYKGAYIAVIMKMLDAIDAGESPTILGDGSEAFDFISVEDCAAANICAMKAEISDRFYNVGTGKRTSLKELAEILMGLTDCKKAIKYAPRSQATLVRNRIGCPKRATKELQFTSRVELTEGLKQLIDWRSRHKEELEVRRREVNKVVEVASKPTKRNISISTPSIGEEEWQACREPLISGWLTQGPIVKKFEEDFARIHSVKYALATTSCTTGLHLVLAALKINPGDEVIVPAFTWVATANAVIYCGATPILVDVDKTTNNIDLTKLAGKITAKTRAVIVVHLFGLCVDMDELRSIVPKHVKIIEDAACAAGASYKGKFAGGLGDAAVFSFHPRKSITTGEGGMITTNDEQIAESANTLRNHGASLSEEQRHNGAKPYLLPDFEVLGFNYRMTDLQGAVGRVQLSKLQEFIAARQKAAENYRVHLAAISWLSLPIFPQHGQHAWQAFVIYVHPEKAPCTRNEIMEILQEKGISTRPGTHAVHMLKYYRDRFNFEPDDFIGARDCDQNTIAIPLHNRMTTEDYDYVIKALQEIG